VTEEGEAALSAAFLMRFIVLLCVVFLGAMLGGVMVCDYAALVDAASS
jgi:hypothetical protein